MVEAVIAVKGGGEVVRLRDRATVREIVTAGSFELVFGHSAEEAGQEVPTYGWQYANLCFWGEKSPLAPLS